MFYFSLCFVRNYMNCFAAINTPAATAVPITPETFGPMACITRKLEGSSSWPTLLDTRAAIGTADTPAEPIRGLIFFLRKRFMNFAMRTPAAVAIAKAKRPIKIIPKDWGLMIFSGVICEPTPNESNIETNVKLLDSNNEIDFICCLQSYACEIIYDEKIPEFHGTKIYDLRDIKIKSNKNNGALIYTYIKLFKMLQNLGNCAAIEYDRYGIEE